MTRPSTLCAYLSVLALTACGDAETEGLTGDAPPPIDTVESGGSRLTARFVDGDGGARRFLHFVDNETGEPCRFSNRRDEVDTVFCIPAASGVVIHRNSSCDDPVVAAPYEGHDWVYAPTYDSPSAVRVGERVAQHAPYYFDSGRGCLEWTGDRTNVHAIAERRELESFPSGRLVERDANDRLKTVAFEGDDGSFAIEVLMDSLANVVCRPGETELGPRCIPEIAEVDILDEDIYDTTCERPMVASYTAGGVGRIQGRDDTIYRFTATEWGAPVARLVDGACVVDETFHQGRHTLYFIDPYPMSEWPEVTLTPIGGPQVVARRAATPDGAPIDARTSLQPDALFDLTGESTPCGPAWMNGTLRCAPEMTAARSTWREAFGDASCTLPAVVFRQRDVEPPRYIRHIVGRTPAAKASLFEVSVTTVGAAARTPYWKSERGCLRLEDENTSVFLVGDPVPADRFPVLTLSD